MSYVGGTPTLISRKGYSSFGQDPTVSTNEAGEIETAATAAAIRAEQAAEKASAQKDIPWLLYGGIALAALWILK